MECVSDEFAIVFGGGASAKFVGMGVMRLKVMLVVVVPVVRVDEDALPRRPHTFIVAVVPIVAIPPCPSISLLPRFLLF